VQRRLSDVVGLVASVPLPQLRTVVNELGTAFAGTGGELQRLLDSTSALTDAATAMHRRFAVPAAFADDGPLRRTIDKVVARLPLGSYRAVGFPYKPTTITSAQLNLQYCLAIMLLENDVFVPQFTDEKIGSPAVLSMIDRIEIVHDPELDRVAGDRISPETRVEVKLTDGRTLAATGAGLSLSEGAHRVGLTTGWASRLEGSDLRQSNWHK